MRKIDRSSMLGQVFGSWVVMDIANSGTARHPKVLCRCSCGTVGGVNIDNLLSGKSTACKHCRSRTGNMNGSWKGYGAIPANFFGILKKSAEARNLKFDITIQDLDALWRLCGGVCALSGQPISICGKKMGFSASVDRIDSSLGYAKGNIQFVHKDVNLMKNRFSEEYFVATCNMVAENFYKRGRRVA